MKVLTFLSIMVAVWAVHTATSITFKPSVLPAVGDKIVATATDKDKREQFSFD